MKGLLHVVAVTLLIAAFAPARAAEKITVLYNDGKSDTGELLSQDPDKIVLRVTLGDNHIDMPITWTRIKKLSNDLTQEDATKKWKADNQAKLCPECNGEKKVPCKTCAARGLLARALIQCSACKGDGTCACTNKDCDKGQVPCPNKCLKLTEGKWVKGKEDLLWRRFDYKGGFWEWSERHLGDVIEYGADGVPVDKGKCPVCGGTTKVTCKVCDGKSVIACPLCKGTKEIPEPGAEKKCPDCNGMKKITCPTCKGTGLKS